MEFSAVMRSWFVWKLFRYAFVFCRLQITVRMRVQVDLLQTQPSLPMRSSYQPVIVINRQTLLGVIQDTK